MEDNIKNLITEFKKISNKKWIRSISNSFGSNGLTFESELKKKPDSLYFPDYYGIELKCTSFYSKYPLYLFTVAFDGPTFPEINRIIDEYGYPDKDFPDKKVLFEKVYCTKKTIVNKKYKFKLEIDRNEEKLYLCVYSINNKVIERKSFVYLDSIRNHLELKLNTLAFIYSKSRIFNNIKYFRYYQINIYKLKSFEFFLNLLNEGIIDVSIISRISKSGQDKGRYRNKNLVFEINKKNIPLLFDEIYKYNSDIYII